MFVVLAVATERVISMRSDFFRAFAPGLAVGLYVVLVVWVNQTKLRIDQDGVRYTYGPLPSGARDRYFPSADIQRLYIRSYADLSRYGGHYRAVGMGTKSGFAFDLLREELPAPTIEAQAGRMAKHLRWTAAPELIDGALPGRPLQSWVAWMPLLVALTLSGGWILWVFQ